MVGRNGTHRQACKCCKLFGKCCRAGLQMQALQFELGRGETGLQLIAERGDSGLGALLLDLNQPSSKGFLLTGAFKFCVYGIEFDVSR